MQCDEDRKSMICVVADQDEICSKSVELEMYIFSVGCEQWRKICVWCIRCWNVKCALWEVKLRYKGDSECCMLKCALHIVFCVYSVYL